MTTATKEANKTDPKAAPAAGKKPSEQTHKVETALAPMKPNETALALTFDAFDEVGADFEGGETISGGFEGVMWVPQLTQFRDEVIQEKMASLGLSWSTRPFVGGHLAQKMAWGEMRYVLDLPAKGGGTIRCLIPSHVALYALLGSVRLGAKVAVMFDGFGKAKPNQNAPARYKIKVANPADVLSMKRADALVPSKKKNDDDDDAVAGERI